jgi:RNA polymerase sigma-70 factor (ECF subfamily)
MSAHVPVPNRSSANASGATSTSLLERMKFKDQDAWQKFVDLYGPLVYRWCRCWGISSTDSQDVMQEVLRAVASGIGRFERDRAHSTFRGWLWTIARNVACDHFARQGNRPLVIGGTDLQRTLLHIPEQCPEDDSKPEVASELGGVLRRALAAIRGDFQEWTWQMFWRTTIEGEIAAEVARDLGSTSRAVRQAKHRVLQRLREEYRDLIGPPQR